MKFLAYFTCSLLLAQNSVHAAAYKTEKTTIMVSEYAKGFDKPWGMSFLPGGRLLVTEQPGRLKLVEKSGEVVEVKGVQGVQYSGQGGLLDVLVDPKFSQTKYIFLSYAEKRKGGSGTTVARAQLEGHHLKNYKVVWRQEPTVNNGYHFGSRLVIDPERHLFITMGDRYGGMKRAQFIDNHFGKVVRVGLQGLVPKTNPFYNSAGAKKDIWSLGHRNVQGAIWHPVFNELWTHEHGAKGGDEINIDRAGLNYGWPVITHGIDYSGKKIGIGTHKKRMEQPLHYWNPSIAPCGMLYYSGKMFPEWKGNIFIGSLKYRYLNRITFKGAKVIQEEKLLTQIGDRVRDVEEGPDGSLYVAFDKMNAPILRIHK